MEYQKDFSHMRDILEQVIGPYNDFKMSTSDNKWYRDPKFFNDFVCGKRNLTETKNKHNVMYDEEPKNRARGDRCGEEMKNGFNSSVAAADLLLSDDDSNEAGGVLQQRKNNLSSQASSVDNRLLANTGTSASMCANDSTKATGMKKWVVRKKERDGLVELPLGASDMGTPNKTSAEPSVIAAVRSCLSFKVLASPVAPLSDSDTDTMGDFMESDGVDSAHTPLTDKMAYDPPIDTNSMKQIVTEDTGAAASSQQRHLARKLFGDCTSSDENEEEEEEEVIRGNKMSNVDARHRLTYNDDVYEADDMEDILMQNEIGSGENDNCRLNTTVDDSLVSSRSSNNPHLIQRHGLTQFSILLSLLDKLEQPSSIVESIVVKPNRQAPPLQLVDQEKSQFIASSQSIASTENKSSTSASAIATTTLSKHHALPKIPKKKRLRSPSSPSSHGSLKRIHSDGLYVSKSSKLNASPSSLSSSRLNEDAESTKNRFGAFGKTEKRSDESFASQAAPQKDGNERKSSVLSTSSPSRSTRLNGMTLVRSTIASSCRLVEKGTQMEPEPPQPLRNKAVNMVRPHTVTTRVASQEFDSGVSEHVQGASGLSLLSNGHVDSGDVVLRMHHEVKREVKNYEARVLATNPEIFFNEATELKRQLERMQQQQQHDEEDEHCHTSSQTTYMIVFLNMMQKFLCGCFCQEEQARNRAIDNYIKTKELVHYYSNKIERRFKSRSTSTSKPAASASEKVRTQFTLLLCNMIRGFVSMQLFRMQRREINTLRNDINRDRQHQQQSPAAHLASSEMTTSTPSPAAPGAHTEQHSKIQRYFKLMESIHSGLEYWCFVEQLRLEGGSALKSVEEVCIRRVGHSTPQLMDPLALFLRYLTTVTNVLADEQLILSSLL